MSGSPRSRRLLGVIAFFYAFSLGRQYLCTAPHGVPKNARIFGVPIPTREKAFCSPLPSLTSKTCFSLGHRTDGSFVRTVYGMTGTSSPTVCKQPRLFDNRRGRYPYRPANNCICFLLRKKTTDIPHSSFLVPHSEEGSSFLVPHLKTADIISRFCYWGNLFYKFFVPVAVGEYLGRFSVLISYYRQVLAADHKVNVDHTFVNALLL